MDQTFWRAAGIFSRLLASHRKIQMTQESAAATSGRKNVRQLRRRFLSKLFDEMKVVWPIASGFIAVIVSLGIIIGIIEGWSLQDSVYFSFVTGLTIGYGELVPKTLLTRGLAMMIGATGILLTALIAAVAVSALGRIHDER
jgi:hypothetical protein